MATFSDIRRLAWNQLGASIDMLRLTLEACPDHVWGDKVDWYDFWYIASHTLFFLDYHVSGMQESFAPPPPFGMEETDPAGVLPPRVYTREELLTYLAYCRQKAKTVLDDLSEDQVAILAPLHREGWRLPYLELLVHVTRHNSHHVGQLNLLIRQRADQGSKWVWQALPD